MSTNPTYIYDGNGLRVKKCVPNCTSPTTTTVYIFSGSKVVAEYDNGAAVGSPSREYVYGGSALLAKIDSSGTKYYHQDHLSNRLVTDSSGNTLTQMGHFPFRESWYNATGDKLFFTTYERDAESGNDYAQARYYVNRLALFSALDPLSGFTMDPQTLNRYDYVRNNPISSVDPTGQNRVKTPGDCDPDQQDCSGGAGFEGDNGGIGFCGADSESCGAGYGGTDLNGNPIPWDFGPGYLMQTTSPLATLAAAQSRYLSIIKYGWDPELQIQYYEYEITGADRSSRLEQQKELAAIQLGQQACAGQAPSAVEECILQAYNTLTVALDANGKPLPVGGNFNFNYSTVRIGDQSISPGDLGCTSFGDQTRCGVLDSLHFHASSQTFHVDTGNAWAVPVGSLFHLVVDVIGGNTWWRGGIPH